MGATYISLLNVDDKGQQGLTRSQAHAQAQRGLYATNPLTGRVYFGSPTHGRRRFASAEQSQQCRLSDVRQAATGHPDPSRPDNAEHDRTDVGLHTDPPPSVEPAPTGGDPADASNVPSTPDYLLEQHAGTAQQAAASAGGLLADHEGHGDDPGGSDSSTCPRPQIPQSVPPRA